MATLPSWLPLRGGGDHSRSSAKSASLASLSPQQDTQATILSSSLTLIPEDANLRILNESLLTLAAIFPDIQAEVFREMLGSFDEESRLHVVTETLLKHKDKWVRGRWRVAGNEEARSSVSTRANSPSQGTALPVEERFRSEAYRTAVKNAFYQEFKGLSHSTINAVLAEHNHSYTLTRPVLSALAAKSWRFALSRFLSRRKITVPSSVEDHPLIVMRPVDGQKGRSVPVLKSTESSELNRELFDSLIAPVLRQQREEQEDRDRTLATELNNKEAEQYDAMQDCECCFMPTAFEQLSACDSGGHFICFRCLRYTVSEALFGQGWISNVNHQSITLRCIASVSSGESTCSGSIPQPSVKRALADERNGKELWRKMEERIMNDGLTKSDLPLVRCPFCVYAEVDDIYLGPNKQAWRFKRKGLLSLATCLLFFFATGTIPFLIPLLIMAIFILPYLPPFQVRFTTALCNSLTRLRRARYGLKFTCKNPICRRSSCLTCQKEWRDIHVCYESEKQALRSTIERAMAEAVKRTCPRCNLSFVKSTGCNKLTCVCGYQMCYVCRRDVAREGYRHFCEHFRPNPGHPCVECVKCDLYRCEDEEVAVRRAGELAEKQWWEQQAAQNASAHGSPTSIRQGLQFPHSSSSAGSLSRIWAFLFNWKVPARQDIFDSIVDLFFE
ncbi:hypothetical protein L228DRAFT_236511 [Xylona heveae TC161]|uniref:RING-type domain-containing protein n=1 Tax=Xylona heveae (strain CBS 132557 / TC161) TaxID=1328760 RepID=A0A165IUI8_XYLHT|nr:hypothetical protein L228DRAFT_236511 [Xylona heveae TC161]KZF25409.1 hypothetical protein L228DRAFT_236511 [Xylona heveae TC161]